MTRSSSLAVPTYMHRLSGPSIKPHRLSRPQLSGRADGETTRLLGPSSLAALASDAPWEERASQGVQDQLDAWRMAGTPFVVVVRSNVRSSGGGSAVRARSLRPFALTASAAPSEEVFDRCVCLLVREQPSRTLHLNRTGERHSQESANGLPVRHLKCSGDCLRANVLSRCELRANVISERIRRRLVCVRVSHLVTSLRFVRLHGQSIAHVRTLVCKRSVNLVWLAPSFVRSIVRRHNRLLVPRSNRSHERTFDRVVSSEYPPPVPRTMCPTTHSAGSRGRGTSAGCR